MIYKDAEEQVYKELGLARQKFPPFTSPHEGYAIILEELEELKAEIFLQHDKRDVVTMRKEAKQVAAMAMRFMIDLT